jgi:hypothetical protein
MLSAHSGILLLTPVERKKFFFFIVFFRTSIGTPWLGANEASAQGLQNTLYNECHTKFLMELWAFENRQFVW